MFENSEKTNLSELGEFGLIQHLTKDYTPSRSSTVMGIGDDAAVIDTGAGNVLVLTNDTLVEGVHFDMVYTPLKHLGYKSVVVNLSDVVAMNARPSQIVLSMAISSKYTLEAIEAFYEGVYAACKQYNVDLVGGDTTSSLSGLVVSISAIGEARKEEIVYRNGASESELICVSGDLGGAYAGLQVLEREKSVYIDNPKMQPDLEGFDYILQRQLKPEARLDVIDQLKELEVKPTAMIDISDGLSSELFHIATSSSCGITVYEDKLPIDQLTYDTMRDMNIDPTTAMLNGGEDYELLFSIRQEDYEKIKHLPTVTTIGHMTTKGMTLISKDGKSHELKAQGWKHLN